jgi:outer membrane cobalamin receptor
MPVVYVDNVRFGDLETLQSIPITGIAEIRYMSGPDATTRWGTGVLGGVIEVIRKR